MEFSTELQEKLKALTPAQRRGVALICQAEIERLPISYLFKTSYSCRWCGKPVGRTGQSNEQRHADLTEHEVNCKHNGKEWVFVANASTYYDDWLKNPVRAVAQRTRRKRFCTKKPRRRRGVPWAGWGYCTWLAVSPAAPKGLRPQKKSPPKGGLCFNPGSNHHPPGAAFYSSCRVGWR